MPDNGMHVDGFVRVRDKDTGVKRSVPTHELPHGNYEQLKGATHSERTGDVLPPEFPESAPAASATTGKKD